ncbi:DUF6153 family protein [Streptomyces purpurogeneiscleroticus]|uniref:DUF6153 family protein n=1 Tax=Streptomyces purpurogeneiscleroticus TaxID=68259 RepID=UPI001CBAA32D|nr:DUF6153 family protein [Streptomyces purpurogeneiscleroticus]
MRSSVPSTAPSASTPPARRWRALLVLGLLAGLLGMHALAPVATAAAPSHQHHGAMAATAQAAHHGGCADDGCGSGTHRGHHADATCASGAIPGGPALPDLLPGAVVPPEAADAPCAAAPTSEHGSRAPPSLAELQLLRI